jgi:hypothetical protein
VKKGQTCPRCSAFATIEPGGLRCSRCGYTPIFRRILPCTHQLSGRDWRNRERQRALDRTLIRAGRMEEVLFELLERLEGRQEPVVATAWNREHRGVAPRIRDDDELTGDAGRFRWNSDLTAEERKAAIESGLSHRPQPDSRMTNARPQRFGNGRSIRRRKSPRSPNGQPSSSASKPPSAPTGSRSRLAV